MWWLWVSAAVAALVLYLVYRDAKWRENPISKLSRAEFENLFWNINRRFPSLEPSEIYTKMTEILEAKEQDVANSKWEKAEPMRVQYTVKHHDDKPCEREIVIPDGYEACSFKQAIRDNGMSAVIGAWVKTELSCRSVSSLHIRPIKRIEPPDGYEIFNPIDFPSQKDFKVHLHGEWRELGATAQQAHEAISLCTGLHEVFFARPTAIKRIELEVGAWYELSHHGGVHRCRFSPVGPDAFEVGGGTYLQGGSAFYASGSRPRILRRVYVSETPVLGREFFQAAAEKYKTPFRLGGPGWYKHSRGDWVRMTDSRIEGYRIDGTCLNPEDRLIARATPEQERVLEGL